MIDIHADENAYCEAQGLRRLDILEKRIDLLKSSVSYVYSRKDDDAAFYRVSGLWCDCLEMIDELEKRLIERIKNAH